MTRGLCKSEFRAWFPPSLRSSNRFTHSPIWKQLLPLLRASARLSMCQEASSRDGAFGLTGMSVGDFGKPG
jgi:hypothetical protein